MNSRLALKDNVSGSDPASHNLGTEGHPPGAALYNELCNRAGVPSTNQRRINTACLKQAGARLSARVRRRTRSACSRLDRQRGLLPYGQRGGVCDTHGGAGLL
jgi:hypothetical protein